MSLTQKGSEVFDRDRKITEHQAKLDACETAKKLAIAEAVEKKNFRLANNKADELSIKKLTKNAPSVKAMFDDLKREG